MSGTGGRVATVLSAVTLIVAALAPGLIASGSPLALVRIPLECILSLVLLVLIPWAWPRRVVAVAVALLLVLAAV
ncbi:MAG TPA: hypothetical protein VIG28_01240, partial [Leifsonia sp.]